MCLSLQYIGASHSDIVVTISSQCLDGESNVALSS
jgi:hypothetical protein